MMPSFSKFIALALFPGLLTGALARANEATAGEYVVVAIAADIQSVVLRDSHGIARHIKTGSPLLDGGWRVASIGAEILILRAQLHLQGRQVELQLREGDHFDPLALTAMIQSKIEPIHGAERMIPELPASKRTKR